MQNIIYGGFDEEVERISSTDVLRWARFVQDRESQGLTTIEGAFDRWQLDDGATYKHGKEGRDFYFRLEKALRDAFALNTCVGSKDVFAVLDKVPNPPGCRPSPASELAEFHRRGGSKDAFNCPLQPMSIRNNLVWVAKDMKDLNRTMLDKMFRKGVGGH